MSICLFLSINFLRSSLRAFTSWVRTLSLTSYSEIALNFSVSEMNLALTSSVSFWLVSSLIWVAHWMIVTGALFSGGSNPDSRVRINQVFAGLE